MIRTHFAWRCLTAGLLIAAAANVLSAKQAAAHKPPAETVTPLFQRALPNVDGKTFTSVIVKFPPSARATPHRHGGAFVYAYVLAGALRSKLDDGPVRTYRAGESWCEPPGAHHVLTENVSATKPAKLLAIFISKTGETLKVNDSERR